MLKEITRIYNLYQTLIGQPPIPFPKVGERLSVPETHGVYVIYGPRKKVLHVGRTLRGRKGLRQRLNNHLHGNSSFTMQYLNGRGEKLRHGHAFTIIEIPDSRTRALVEAYAVGNLCPKHLGLGNKVS